MRGVHLMVYEFAASFVPFENDASTRAASRRTMHDREQRRMCSAARGPFGVYQDKSANAIRQLTKQT
jgi:hypothetical protein